MLSIHPKYGVCSIVFLVNNISFGEILMRSYPPAKELSKLNQTKAFVQSQMQ